MTHMTELLPAVACVALMFGGSALAWLARKTHASREPWLRGRLSDRADKATPPTT